MFHVEHWDHKNYICFTWNIGITKAIYVSRGTLESQKLYICFTWNIYLINFEYNSVFNVPRGTLNNKIIRYLEIKINI